MTSRVALITGAARGLGRAVARAIGETGTDLFLVDILQSELEATQSAMRSLGVNCEIQICDISTRANCKAAVEAAVAAFGRLDVLCNVAGVGWLAQIADLTEDDWERLIAVNVGATLWFCQAGLPHLLKTGGNIINVSSQGGITGRPYIAPYAASKAAVIQMTKALAVEFHDSPIRINVVCPGHIETDMGTLPIPEGLDPAKMARFHGARQASSPEDVAAIIAFVASPASKVLHGAVIMADNGDSAG
jgi:meso-butanediol dehydrogenase/(S,S)-butanediol dehydrogenase/diacetyl reductase